jgi:hypothetical protein
MAAETIQAMKGQNEATRAIMWMRSRKGGMRSRQNTKARC